MGCNSCGGGSASRASYGRWVVKLADGTELPYASEWEARQAVERNPGSSYAWVTTT